MHVQHLQSDEFCYFYKFSLIFLNLLEYLIKWTGIIAFVFLLINFSIFLQLIFKSSPISASLGFIPAYAIAPHVAMNELETVIISSFDYIQAPLTPLLYLLSSFQHLKHVLLLNTFLHYLQKILSSFP